MMISKQGAKVFYILDELCSLLYVVRRGTFLHAVSFPLGAMYLSCAFLW